MRGRREVSRWYRRLMGLFVAYRRQLLGLVNPSGIPYITTLQKLLPFCLLMMLGIPARSEPMTWDEVMSAMGERLRILSDEEKAVEQQLKTVEEQAQIQDGHVESLKTRLATLKGTRGSAPQLPMGPETGAGGTVTASGATTDYRIREKELIDRSAGRMLVVEGKQGKPTGGFLAPQDGEIRIFVSARWLDENPRPTVSKLDRSSLPICEELSCPVGVDLVCLHPDASDLPHFELTEASKMPVVGARVLVISLDPDSKQAKGVSGSIRGIGPDTLELDAELTSTMTGAPVLSLDSGRVIGVVAPQIAGVADEWAIGTRHQGSRNFAFRMDRIEEWKTSNLGRFAKEAAYIQGINQRTRIAWLAHMLMADRMSTWEYKRANLSRTDSQERPGPRKVGESIEQFVERRARELEDYDRKREREESARLERAKFIREVQEEATNHATNPHIARVNSWLNEPLNPNVQAGGGEERIRLSNIYRSILADLSKQEPDLSEHMTPYHLQQYRIAKATRSEGIRIIAQHATRVGQ